MRANVTPKHPEEVPRMHKVGLCRVIAYRMNLDRIGTTSVAIACARVPLILLRDSTLS